MELPANRRHFPDEMPDVDEREPEEIAQADDMFARHACRCDWVGCSDCLARKAARATARRIAARKSRRRR